MFKKILVIFLGVVFCAVLSAYFWCADRFTAREAGSLCCDAIKVVITNPRAQNFISEEEVVQMVRPMALGKRIDGLDVNSLENYLCNTSAICQAEAYVRNPATLTLEVTQRNPVLRFQTDEGGFYCDSSGFILPLLGKVTLDLPVVSGHLLFDVPKKLSGHPAEGQQWLRDLLRMTETIRMNPYWSREIEQIWVEKNSDIVLYMRSCDEKFIFGPACDTDAKLLKLAGYYRTIRPQAAAKGKKYTTVNLKYKDQIICK